MKRFQDRVAIVTGSGRENGIGEAIALRLASEGAHLALVDMERQSAELEAVAQKVRAHGGKVITLHANLTAESEIEAMTEKAWKEFGRIDALFNNASAASRGGPIENMALIDLDREAWDFALSVTSTATFLCSKHVAHKIIAGKRGGSIVNTISISAYFGQPGLGAYSAAKIAVHALTRTLAIELAPHDIRVNAFSPGMTATQWLRDRYDAVVAEKQLNKSTNDFMDERAAAIIPLRRPANPSEMASVAAFLASDDASYMTGQMLMVDGGLSVK